MTHYFLTGELSITLTDEPGADRRYCIVCGARAFHASERLAALLGAIQAESDLSLVTRLVNAGGGSELGEDQVRDIIERQLVPSGLVSLDAAAAGPVAAKHDYLFFARTLIRSANVVRLSAPLSVLASPRVATLLTCVCVVLVGCWFHALSLSGITFSTALASLDLTVAESAGFYLLLTASLLCHELGHAAVSYRHGARPAEIGFGLYLIFPAFFCNVTEAWRLPRAERVAINLGGVYFQLLATAAMVPFALVTRYDVLDLLIASNLMSIVITLNPFFRFDGYWVYSDLFRLPNLRDRSRAYTIALLQRVVRGGAPAPAANGAPRALRAYAVASGAFFTFFTVNTAIAASVLVGRMPEMARATARHLASAPGAAAWGVAAGGAAMLLLYLLACLLSLQYVLTRLRGAWQLLAEGRGAAPHQIKDAA